MLVLLRGRLVKRCTRVPCHEYDGGQANDNSLDQELLKQVSIASLRHALLGEQHGAALTDIHGWTTRPEPTTGLGGAG